MGTIQHEVIDRPRLPLSRIYLSYDQQKRNLGRFFGHGSYIHTVRLYVDVQQDRVDTS